MPSTFPSHPAAILPLKLWRPRWFDGVALVLGSMAPDAAYLLDGSGLPVWPFSHEVAGLVGWCLPLTVVGTVVVRRAAPVIAVHLPAPLRDYGLLRAARHRWWITVVSALIGAASHLVLDRFEQRVPAVEWVLHVAGVLAMVLLLRHIGRHRLLRRWYGSPSPARCRPALFWSAALAVTLPVVAVIPFLPAAFLPHTTGVRALGAVGAGLLAGALAVTVARDRVVSLDRCRS